MYYQSYGGHHKDIKLLWGDIVLNFMSRFKMHRICKVMYSFIRYISGTLQHLNFNDIVPNKVFANTFISAVIQLLRAFLIVILVQISIKVNCCFAHPLRDCALHMKAPLPIYVQEKLNERTNERYHTLIFSRSRLFRPFIPVH